MREYPLIDCTKNNDYELSLTFFNNEYLYNLLTDYMKSDSKNHRLIDVLDHDFKYTEIQRDDFIDDIRNYFNEIKSSQLEDKLYQIKNLMRVNICNSEKVAPNEL